MRLEAALQGYLLEGGRLKGPGNKGTT